MKKLLNTLYVTTPGTYLARDGEAILVKQEGGSALRVPVISIGAVVCFGNVMCSPPMMELCAKSGVSLAFMTERGRFMARVQGPVSGNVLLRREQYRWADDEARCVGVAGAMVAAKIANARYVLLRAARERPEGDVAERLSKAAEELAGYLASARQVTSLDRLRGLEGMAANGYFRAFDDLIASQKKPFRFAARTRRPPTDPMNALLSFLYTILANDAAAALEGVGLDPAVGFLHRDRPGRAGLALDIMEELRPYLADRLALTLVNRLQVKAKGFKATESGAVTMTDATRKAVLVAYQERKREEITHPYLGEKTEIGLLPHVQTLLLARHIRGDIDGYPAFFAR